MSTYLASHCAILKHGRQFQIGCEGELMSTHQPGGSEGGARSGPASGVLGGRSAIAEVAKESLHGYQTKQELRQRSLRSLFVLVSNSPRYSHHANTFDRIQVK